MTTSVMRVDLGNVDQYGIPSNQYHQIAWRGVPQNQSGLWTTTGLIPPCGPFMAQWQVWVNAGFGGSNPSMVVKCIKNATVDGSGNLNGETGDLAAAIGGSSGISGTACCGASVSDVANGTDTYNLFIYATASNPNVGCTIDSNPAHTWFSATSFG